MIETLIDKQDNVEIIRSQIASILVIESANQVALATAEGQPNPDQWRLRVYEERANAWETFPTKTQDTAPVVNVWWETSSFEMASSNIVERQKSEGIFNIDCYGYAISADDPTGGHTPGDMQAAFNAQQAIRYVRNILMAAQYTYLDLRGVVWRRWINSITMFQPQQDNQNVHQAVAGRVAFRVEFNELSPQVVPSELCLLSVGINRAEDGELLVQADYDYTA